MPAKLHKRIMRAIKAASAPRLHFLSLVFPLFSHWMSSGSMARLTWRRYFYKKLV